MQEAIKSLMVAQNALAETSDFLSRVQADFDRANREHKRAQAAVDQALLAIAEAYRAEK